MTKKMLNETLKEIESVTGGERFINWEQLEEIEFIPYVYVENCGISGTGKGTWYNLYMMDKDGNKTDEKLGEVVVNSVEGNKI